MKIFYLFILGIAIFGLTPSQVRASELKAVFAGGCFWCMEASFDKLDGVIDVRTGFSGGHKVDPTYREVVGGDTGHTEAVEVTYDPAKVDYETLIGIYWDNVDPTDASGQFCDRGSSYRPVIFVDNDSERLIAERTKNDLAKKLGQKIVVPIQKRETFYYAGQDYEDYHKTNPLAYALYRQGCGQDRTLDKLKKQRGE